MKRTIYATVFALLCIVGLSACSTDAFNSSSKYNNNYRAYQPLNLPADYPTKYLPDGNLWDDFRKNLQLPANATSNRRVQEQIRWIQTHQGYINRSLTRGAQYFYYIYQQTKLRHLPPELALIPVYESGYVPIGRSPKGAVGLWQFMPGTAAGYGMRMDRWFDGRRDVVSSTNAALKYFTYLHYFFNDWLLAIAAYDHGPGNVQSKVLRNQRRGLGTDFWSLAVPQETNVYVPQLLALAAVIKNPAKYGVSLVPINNGPYFEQINVGKAVDINKYAKLSGIDTGLMRSLNAGYLRTTMDPDGPYVLLVPRSKVATFKAKVSGSRSGESETESTAAPTLQVAKKLATAKARPNQYSTPLQASTRANQRDSAEAVSDDNDDGDVAKNSNDSAPDDTASGSNNAVGTIPYRVARGDTVYNLAKKFKVSPAQIKSINNLRSNNVKAGRLIKISHTPVTTFPPKNKTGAKAKVVSAKSTNGVDNSNTGAKVNYVAIQQKTQNLAANLPKARAGLTETLPIKNSPAGALATRTTAKAKARQQLVIKPQSSSTPISRDVVSTNHKSVKTTKNDTPKSSKITKKPVKTTNQ